MTDPVITVARLQKVKGMSNCPVCGSIATRHVVSTRSAMAVFSCGSMFGCFGDEPISCALACPTSGNVAADALNREVETKYRADIKAGAA
jgi:hypothetical protein